MLITCYYETCTESKDTSRVGRTGNFMLKIRLQKIVRTLGAQNVNGRSQNEMGGFGAEDSHGNTLSHFAIHNITINSKNLFVNFR